MSKLMTTAEWEALAKKDYDAWLKAYRDYMPDEAGAYDHEHCPCNEGFDDFQGRYPCGQWRCWHLQH